MHLPTLMNCPSKLVHQYIFCCLHSRKCRYKYDVSLRPDTRLLCVRARGRLPCNLLLLRSWCTPLSLLNICRVFGVCGFRLHFTMPSGPALKFHFPYFRAVSFVLPIAEHTKMGISSTGASATTTPHGPLCALAVFQHLSNLGLLICSYLLSGLLVIVVLLAAISYLFHGKYFDRGSDARVSWKQGTIWFCLSSFEAYCWSNYRTFW